MLFLIFAFIVCCLPLILTFFNFLELLNSQPSRSWVEMCVFTLGPALSLIFYGMMEFKDWQTPALTSNFTLLHAPIATSHLFAPLLLFLLSVLGYTLLRAFHQKMPPLCIVLCLSALYIGVALCVVWGVQLFRFSTFWNNNQGPLIAFALSLFPFNYVLYIVKLVRTLVRAHAQGRPPTDAEDSVAPTFLARCERLLQKSRRWPLIAFFAMWPLLGVCIGLLVLLGQQPDAVIRAFTETSDWTLSQRVAPAPVFHDAHYLCTVAAGGHRRLVKPQRMGVRHGHRIVVNRQLCVANAFEELLMERTPRFHKAVRHVYDTYGYPLSKHIRTPLAADIVYLCMKPLEWCFVGTLYLLDRDPETRIAWQYLPLAARSNITKAGSMQRAASASKGADAARG